MSYLFAAFISCFLAPFVTADNPLPKFCSTNDTVCKQAGIRVQCVVNSDCTKEVAEGKADLTHASAKSMIKYDNLKIVFGQKLKGVPMKNVQYYGIAVVKRNSTFDINQLKGRGSCHTGPGRNAGWIIPVGYLLFKEKMPFVQNQYKSAAEFFGKSCLPGIKTVENVSEAVEDQLCSLCNGSCEAKGDSAFVEALELMASGKDDRVAFVKQSSPQAFFKKHPKSYGTESDYKLLCYNGGTKDLSEYEDCYIGTKPASALVTSKNKFDETVKKYQELFESAKLDDLKKADMIRGDCESLIKYSGTVVDYLKPYADYYKAVSVGKKNGGSASSNLVSLNLHIFVIITLAMFI
ncbi:serotransferrin-like isoform X2 [Dendronephthya gigantea]|uniref:serotransferrin-like isoform X2 n=1 Tax=Dendronephthya gigantea TaxID=151771 RepID=UPI00106A3CCC|nr:serotransferrin-like isoform X2 [Dendronephthya gigantea]